MADAESTNGTMKAVSQDELGGPDVLKLVTLPTPEPSISQILIRVHTAATEANCGRLLGPFWPSDRLRA